MSEALPNPDADYLERRRRWREFISMDVPVGEKPAVRRAPAIREDDWLPDVIDASPAMLSGLARAIQESMTGDQLTADDRTRLIDRSMRMGLSRFEANLLIAAVVHRATKVRRPPTPTLTAAPKRRWGIAPMLIAALVLEAVALVVGWLWIR